MSGWEYKKGGLLLHVIANSVRQLSFWEYIIPHWVYMYLNYVLQWFIMHKAIGFLIVEIEIE